MSDDQNLTSQAEFARMENVSRKTVTIWKTEGRLVMRDGMVDIAASRKKLADAGRGRPLPPLSAEARKLSDLPEFLQFVEDIREPAQRVAVLAAMSIAYSTPAIAAMSALDAGVSLRTAYRTWQVMRVALAEWVVERLKAMKCEPFASNEDAPTWVPEAVVAPNWKNIAEERGERFEPDRWNRERGTIAASE